MEASRRLILHLVRIEMLEDFTLSGPDNVGPDTSAVGCKCFACKTYRPDREDRKVMTKPILEKGELYYALMDTDQPFFLIQRRNGEGFNYVVGAKTTKDVVTTTSEKRIVDMVKIIRDERRDSQ